MKETELFLYSCTKELGCEFDLYKTEDHDENIFLHYCYIIKKVFGVGISNFSLYINGVDSYTIRELYNTIINNLDYIENESKKYPLTTQTKEILYLIKRIFRNLTTDEKFKFELHDIISLYTWRNYLLDGFKGWLDDQEFEMDIVKSNLRNNVIFIKYLNIFTEDEIFHILDCMERELNNVFYYGEKLYES